jgi:hypothetical protein
MQNFTVPQFIDVEDKIIGPITARQFIIMLSGFMLMVLFYKIFDFSLFLVSSLLTFAISGIFAFFKINGMSFHFFVLNFVQTFRRPSLRLWDNEFNAMRIIEKKIEDNLESTYIPPPPKSFSKSRLSELALIVDTRGAYKGDNS